MPMLVSCEKSQRPTAFATLAVVNVALPSSALTIASVVPSPCGKGHAQLAVGQHIFEPSQVVVVAPPLPPFVTVLPPEEEEVPAEFEEVPPEVALPLPPDAARLSLPLPPHADAKAAAPESSTATAQKLEFEEVRMGQQITSASIQVNVRNGFQHASDDFRIWAFRTFVRNDLSIRIAIFWLKKQIASVSLGDASALPRTRTHPRT